MGRHAISEQKIQQIRELYSTGLSFKLISLQANVTNKTIQKYTQGVDRIIVKQFYEQIVSMRQNGMSTTDISKKLGISREKVSKCCPAKKYMHSKPIEEEKKIVFTRPAAVYTNGKSPYGIYNPGSNQ